MSKVKRWLIAAFVTTLLSLSVQAAADGIVKETLVSGKTKRSYYLFVPAEVAASRSKPAPLVLVFHGSGGEGSRMVEAWKALASKEGVIVAGPNAFDRTRWQTPKDGPEFLYDLVEALKSKYAIDARRVYLFGHSAGSGFAVNMSLLESEYFAATAVHAGAVFREQYLALATRRIPFAFFAGTEDQIFPLRVVRETRDKLAASGFAVRLTELPGHGHNYSSRAAEINRQAWEFFKAHALERDAGYEPRQFKSR